MQTEIQQLGKLIDSSQKILLINHIRMDGDAWGSLGGLYQVLVSIGKDVRAINDDSVPVSLQFLGHTDMIEPDLNVAEFDPDLIISLDASDTGRLGESYTQWEQVFNEKPFVVIDHHISNPGFGDINIIDPKASSTCEMIVLILEKLSLQKHITPQAATFLYTGLQTDSNMYFNTNTRPETLRAGAKLMELGADFRLPIYELYKKRTPDQIRLWEYAFSQITYHFDGKVCGIVLSYDALKDLGIPREEISGYFKGLISEILINIEGVEIAYLIYPLSTSENKASLRSQKGYNVAEICEQFGGGGHMQAAGFQSNDTQIDMQQKLQQKLQKLFI